MTILMLAPVGDLHCEVVGKVLQKRGASYLHCDLAQFPSSLQIGSAIQRDGWQESRFYTNGETYELDRFSAVWDRSQVTSKLIRPVRLGLQSYIQAECRVFLDGFFYLMPTAFWVSNPICVRTAEIKLYQKQVATKLGFRIPDSCIGNAAELARTLAGRHAVLALKAMYRQFADLELGPWERVKKLVHDIKNRKVMKKYRHTNNHVWEELQYRKRCMVYTQQFASKDAEAYLAALPASPVIVQQYIPKKLELRITVVGRKIFPCAIYSQDVDNHGKTDWRGHEDEVRHEPYALPLDIEERCFALLKQLGLQFGAIDLIVTPDNEYVFLENNCFGQWMWVQEKTGMPIAEAIADLLVDKTLGI